MYYGPENAQQQGWDKRNKNVKACLSVTHIRYLLEQSFPFQYFCIKELFLLSFFYVAIYWNVGVDGNKIPLNHISKLFSHFSSPSTDLCRGTQNIFIPKLTTLEIFQSFDIYLKIYARKLYAHFKRQFIVSFSGGGGVRQRNGLEVDVGTIKSQTSPGPVVIHSLLPQPPTRPLTL